MSHAARWGEELVGGSEKREGMVYIRTWGLRSMPVISIKPLHGDEWLMVSDEETLATLPWATLCPRTCRGECSIREPEPD